ncbi:hypothetical protein R1flu_015194 [Riccia fluitans]|uniref:Uncharacterized protein n=1 Tax=Riccia fluitans TaxID=41844 RepID=A0ABD1YIH7_9MARC
MKGKKKTFDLSQTFLRLWQMKIDGVLDALNKIVDVQKLKTSEELITSIEDEAKRQQLDAAKKRAAAQNVDYPCFAALVSCAHLKPMTRKELNTSMEEKKQRRSCSIPAWSFDLSGHLQPATDPSNHSNVNTDFTKSLDKETGDWSNPKSPFLQDDNESYHPPPQSNSEVATSYLPSDLINGHEDADTTFSRVKSCEPRSRTLQSSSDMFIKEWKKLNSADNARMRFLEKIPPSSLPVIFRVELPPYLLGEILQTLHTSIRNFNKINNNKEERENEMSKNNKEMSDNHGATMDSKWTSVEQKKLRQVMDNQTNEEFCFLRRMEEGTRSLTSTEDIEDCENIIKILDALRRCGRFGLAAKFMGQKFRHAATEIINWVFSTTGNITSVTSSKVKALDLLTSYNCN